jgi:hypothetical protein
MVLSITKEAIMRGVPDHSKEEPCPSPEIAVAHPNLIPSKPIPEKLAALGREVLDMVPRQLRGSPEAYRQAASDLCAMLKVNGVRMKPENLYYIALRVKWVMDNTTMESA